MSVAGDVNVLLTPDQRRLNRPIIRIAIQHNTRVAIKTRVRAVLPQSGAVCIWVRDAVEREHGDCEQELDDEEGVH